MEYLFFISEIQYDSTSSLTYPAALRGVAHKIGAEAKGKYISPSSPAVSRSITGCFATQNIGEVSVRTEGLKIPSVKVIEKG